MKSEIILSIMLAVLQPGDSTPEIALTDLPKNVNGHTSCHLYTEHGPYCKVRFDRGALKNRKRINPQLTVAEETVIHELCHVRVFHDEVNKTAEVTSVGWVVSEKEARHLATYRGHGRAWLNCMRKHTGR